MHYKGDNGMNTDDMIIFPREARAEGLSVAGFINLSSIARFILWGSHVDRCRVMKSRVDSRNIYISVYQVGVLQLPSNKNRDL